MDQPFNCLNKQMTLFYACAEGHLDVVQLLIAKSIDVNRPNENGVSPLAIASQNGHIQIVRFLLENKADINSKDKFNSTPLIKALINGHQDTAEHLIKQGADVNFHNNLGYSPLLLACENGSKKLVELLILSGAQLRNKRDPLYVACVHGYYEIAKLLIDHGVDLNTSTRFAGTPLYSSCRKGYINIVRLLVENGANIHFSDSENKTCLGVAHDSGHFKVFDYLSCHLIEQLYNLFQYKEIGKFREQIVNSIDNDDDYPIKLSHVQAFQLMNPKRSAMAKLEDGTILKYFFTFDFREKLLEDLVNNLNDERELLYTLQIKVNQEKANFERTITHLKSDDISSFQDMKQFKYSEMKELLSTERLMDFVYCDKAWNEQKCFFLSREIQRFIEIIDSKIKISNEFYDQLNSAKMIEFRKQFSFF